MRLPPLGILIIVALPVIFVVMFVLPGMAPVEFTEDFSAPYGTDVTTHNPDLAYFNSEQPRVVIKGDAIAPYGSTIVINNHEFTDGCISMDWTGNSTNTNMAIRVSNDFNNFYNFLQQNNNGNWLLRGFYNGKYTVIAQGNNSFEGTHNYKLCADGSTIEVYKDGMLFASGTDSGIPTGGKQSIYSEGNTLDNLSVDDFDDFLRPIVKLLQ